VALALLIAAVISLVTYAGTLPGTKDNARTELLERLGSQYDADARDARAGDGNSIVLGSLERNAASSAQWTMSRYEFAHLLPNTQSCSMRAYVSGPNVSAASRRAVATIDVNGATVARIRFGSIVPEFPIEKGRFDPSNARPARVPMTPLFNPPALIFPLDARFCSADHWQLRVVLKDAIWPIDRVGIVARFSPSPAALTARNPLAYALAFALFCALVLATHALFDAVHKAYGAFALLLTLGIFACALVTHDEWDFPVWLRFVDLAAFGHANPADMWGGTPLWPLGVALLSPILSSIYGATGNGSQEVTALFLKLAMALAASTNAYVLCRLARPALRNFLFPIFLLSPYALYEIAGGYREVFAGSLFLLGASLALRRRFTIAALAFACATSISESLVPLIFLPAALRLAGSNRTARVVGLAILDITAGIGPLVLQWLFLIPHSVIATTLGARVVAAYRFGGGSWLSTLDGFGILPPWAASHSTAVMATIAAMLALPLVARLARDVFARSDALVRREQRVFGAFLGLIAVVFLAYRGIDPSTWYALWVVAAFYFLYFERSVRFPIILSMVQAVAFYAILGIGDFANATYVLPSNQSLLGVLGRPMLVSVLTVNLMILALYISRVSGNAVPFFGRGATWFLGLYFAAIGAGAIQFYPIDVVFCGSVSVLLLFAFQRLASLENTGLERRHEPLDFIGIVSAIVTGAAGGRLNQAATLVAFVATLLGVAFGFGMCDIVLTVGGTLLVATQYGFGWVSIAGYIALSLLALSSIERVLRVVRLRKA
jgi:hypothetical protein